MKAAMSRAGNVFSTIMGQPRWVTHDGRGRTSRADGSSVHIHNRSVWVVHDAAKKTPVSFSCALPHAWIPSAVSPADIYIRSTWSVMSTQRCREVRMQGVHTPDNVTNVSKTGGCVAHRVSRIFSARPFVHPRSAGCRAEACGDNHLTPVQGHGRYRDAPRLTVR